MKRLIVLVLFAFYSAAVAGDSAGGADTTEAKFEPLNWAAPDTGLLNQQYCPIDSSANAMIVQKEMEFKFSYPYMDVISRQRIKIYTERGLSWAQFKEQYGLSSKITAIEAVCYAPDGNKYKLAEADIHEEVLLKSEKRGWKMKNKSFAVPNVTPGCVIDVTIKTTYDGWLSPPIFRFQESIPVEHARFRMVPPSSLFYTFILTNKELLDVKIHQPKDERDIDFICDATNISAIEDELYKLPERNLATDLQINLKGYRYFDEAVNLASDWPALLKGYREDFKYYLGRSGKAKKIADSLKTITSDEELLLKKAYALVRDRWDNYDLPYVAGPSDDIDELLKKKELDQEDKSSVLCSILGYLGKECEVVWVCSDESEYSPLPKYPSTSMYDYALVYIPSDSLFLDASDPGGEVGILDEKLGDRLFCRPMAEYGLIGNTPAIGKEGGSITNLQLYLGDDGTLTGKGNIVFHNQEALEVRRIFRRNGEKEKKEALAEMVLRNQTEAIKSYSVTPDSLATPDIYQVDFEIEAKDFIDPNRTSLDLAAYPGPTFKETTLDINPPRKYPIYFACKCQDIYNVEWNFGQGYRPLNIESLNSSQKGASLSYSMTCEHDPAQNKLSLRRLYIQPLKMFRPDLSAAFEQFLQNAKKCDLATILVEKQ